MIDTSETAERHCRPLPEPGGILHIHRCRNLADRKPRGRSFRPAWLLCAFVLVVAAAQLHAETTIYVGKHFEVRDHDAPVKYVFNGQARVARVTASLSANERIQRLRLRAGWNLVSLAVTAPDFLNQLREFTNGPAPVIKALYRWQPATRDYGTIAPGEGVAAGTVLWVAAQTDSVVAVRGGYVEATEWRAPASGTFVAAPALEAQPLTVPAGATVWRYDARNKRWQAGLTGDLASLSDLPPTLAPGEAIYVHSNDPTDLGAPAREERIRYYHQDHLGSSSAMTDANGALVEETAFYPFGIPRHAHRLRQVEEAYKFTQKERDRESGLHYFEARYLTGGLARFMTQDPMYENPDALAAEDAAAFLATPQKMNMYAYARNNPLSYVDPTGLDEVAGIVPPPLQDKQESGLMKVARVAANISAGAADALPIEPGLNRNSAFLKATGMADTDSGVYKVSYWSTFIASFAIPVGGAANAARGGKAAVSGGEAANVAKSVVDPLAKTPFVTDAYRTTQAAVAAPKVVSKGAVTLASKVDSAVGRAQAAQRAAVAASNRQVATYLEILRPIHDANLQMIKAGVHPSTVLNYSMQQANAVWMSTFRTAAPNFLK